ncbi:hypothetical protein OIV83_004905 [Microbotryomycetes sp. JL201]|nr:hypothetical protein OIV83_004905 [Microbotryomycetes sp. JL201]
MTVDGIDYDGAVVKAATAADGEAAALTPGPNPKLKLAACAWIGLVAAWTVNGQWMAAASSNQGTAAVLLLPVAVFAALVLPAVAIGCTRYQGSFTSRLRATLASSNADSAPSPAAQAPDDSATARASSFSPSSLSLARSAGALSAVSVSMSLYQAHKLDDKVWQAVDVLTLAGVVVIAKATCPLLATSTRTAYASSPLTHLSLVISFLVGLVLIGVPSNTAGLLLALARMPIEALRWIILKEGCDGERSGPFILQTAINAFLMSLCMFVVGLFMPTSENTVAAVTFDAKASAIFLASTIATQALLVSYIYLASTPLTAGTSLIARNLLLLIWNSVGARAAPLRANWMQMAVVLFGGVFATLTYQDDLSSTVSKLFDLGRFRLEDRRRASGWESVEKGATSPSNSSRSRDGNGRDNIIGRTQPSMFLSLVAFVPILVYVVRTPSLASIGSACSYLPVHVQATICRTVVAPQDKTVDLVVSYYNEDLAATHEHLTWLLQTPFVRDRDARVLIYNKGPRTESDIRKGLSLKYVDKVISLPNVGREGHTYLQHIMLHYNDSVAEVATALSSRVSVVSAEQRSKVLADHTIMLQPHLAWHWIAKPRFEFVGPTTGFLHLGPMIRSNCGYDTRVDADFPLVKELWAIFRGEVCPPGGILHFMGWGPTLQTAWSAQFVVSKRRILANSYHRYAAVADLLAAPEGHWIHDMWGANDSHGPSNPAFGHHVERSWPFIMGCVDPKLADECGDQVMDPKCQCFDD